MVSKRDIFLWYSSPGKNQRYKCNSHLEATRSFYHQLIPFLQERYAVFSSLTSHE